MNELEDDGHNIMILNHGDTIFEQRCPEEYAALIETIRDHRILWKDIKKAGGSRSDPTKQLAGKLDAFGWEKENIEITKMVKHINAGLRYEKSTTTHEIDHFIRSGMVGLEIEWNTKDTSFDRDLSTFRVLHENDIINVGIIITRGSAMQDMMRQRISGDKYGASTTHWAKLEAKAHLGISGHCPLICIGLSDKIIVESKMTKTLMEWT